MKIYGADPEQIALAGRDALIHVRQMKRRGKPTVDWVARPAGSIFRNDLGNLCVHGYATFIEAVLRRNPGAKIVTVAATYTSLDGYIKVKDEEIERIKATMGEMCTCDHEDEP